ncbi:metallo-peptidase, Clan MG, Family M24 [Angomonas deanei]|nr:metallo-peptidase, Clan MG, Family M24 [Angomonas deanei]|eukprot:EPY29363.1 metallo-peptidase, Clan MG, Family M24 [Angomonas deanei]
MKPTCSSVLVAVREKMKSVGVQALIVPSSDAHNSEYVAPHFQRRAFITNFKGSAGTALITEKRALLWTDGRYWTEAESSLYPEFELMKQGKLGEPTLEEWLEREMGPDTPVGLDPYVCTVAEWDRMVNEQNVQLQAVEDIVGPLMPPTTGEVKPLYERPPEFCGATRKAKRDQLVKELKVHKCDFMLLSALDEICWLTNLRGDDVPYNPVFYAYAYVAVEQPLVQVYVQEEKITEAIRKSCEKDIVFLPYEKLTEDLRKLPSHFRALVDVRQTSEAVHRILKEGNMKTKKVVCGPAQELKAVKNDVELKGFRACHVRDGVALTRYLAWLHHQITALNRTDLTEYEAATQLQSFREEGEHYVQLSFTTISSTGPNGAIVHYSAPPVGSAAIRKDALYLVDSGAQYMDGTTDVTRTVCFQAPTEEERKMYTLVLKGHIALHRSVFPEGTSGHRIDVLARQALWQRGLDYAHGTGHGVGSFLNVHEGPHGIGQRPVLTGANLKEGCIVSNEPGFYKKGHYGIRIENLEEIVKVETEYTEDTVFLGMRYLTLVPLCRDLIDPTLLSKEEVDFVNTYHKEVQAALSPGLTDPIAVSYLSYHTQPI